jgi:hypothetical protein
LKTLVLDASVAIKWAMPLAREPLTDESVRLLKRYVDSELEEGCTPAQMASG